MITTTNTHRSCQFYINHFDRNLNKMDFMRRYLFLYAVLTLLIYETAANLPNIARLFIGKRESCSEEGERVRLPISQSQKCFFCICKNGYVECNSNCPRVDSCFTYEEKSECNCKICKGCYYNGRYYDSHTEWTDPENPCNIIRCEASIITISEMRCHTPCANPLPPEPGKCCPTCSECRINGQKAAEDRDVVSDDDPCLKCRCRNGQLICTKKACPVLPCSVQSQHKVPGECCPRCNGTVNFFPQDNFCILQANMYDIKSNLSLDRCTNCRCTNSTNVCHRITCPILDCALEEQKLFPTQCCPKCMPRTAVERVQTSCVYRGVAYKDGQEWPLDTCSSCKCKDGKVSCVKTRCNTTCAFGLKKIQLPHECCPVCIEENGVCMAFGDPHYKSFDGKIYTFKGIGKYQLTKDCKFNTFSVKVANSLSGNSTTTKRVAISFGDTRLNLQQRGRVKYNGKRISLPYKKEGKFRVTKTRDLVEVFLQNDVRLLWNGRGFLEVSVPPTYKSKLCGLCGNFNGNVQDDLQTKSGKVVDDKDLLSFGTSWCVGNKTECAKKIKPIKTFCNKSRINLCHHPKSKTLMDCELKLSYNKYDKACKMDMCQCPNNKCYCESLMAYARECERLGINISNWQRETDCDNHHSRRTTNHQRKKNSNQFKFKHSNQNKFFKPDQFTLTRIPDISRKSLERTPMPIE